MASSFVFFVFSDTSADAFRSSRESFAERSEHIDSFTGHPVKVRIVIVVGSTGFTQNLSSALYNLED